MSAKKTQMFVDGNCIVCDFEVSHYKRMAPELFELVDIADPRFVASAHGLTAEAVNREMHVRTPEGEILRGVDAFAHIWDRLPVYRLGAKVVRLPGVNSAARVAYAVFARHVRPRLPKRRKP